jgi:hypothetical protein
VASRATDVSCTGIDGQKDISSGIGAKVKEKSRLLVTGACQL